MGVHKSTLKLRAGTEAEEKVQDDAGRDPMVIRTLDGTNSMKLRTGVMKCSWKQEIPEIFILPDVMRLQDKGNDIIEVWGEQDEIWLGGFQITTRCISGKDGTRLGYALGVNTKSLNLATFEIEVRSNGNIIISGRKLKNSKEGQLRFVTPPRVLPGNVSVDAVDNNRVVWIKIYFNSSNSPHQLQSQETEGRSGEKETFVAEDTQHTSKPAIAPSKPKDIDVEANDIRSPALESGKELSYAEKGLLENPKDPPDYISNT